MTDKLTIILYVGEYLAICTSGISLIIMILYVCNACKHNKNASKLAVLLGFFGIICYMISSITRALYHYYSINSDSDNIICDIFEAMQSIFWHFGNLFCYFLYMNSLYYAFNASRYAFSKISCGIVFFMILLYCMCLCTLIPAALIKTKMDDVIDVDVSGFESNKDVYHDIYRLGTQILDIIISMVLLVLFIRKLRLITENLYEMESLQSHLKPSLSVSDMDVDSRIYDSKEILFNLMAKMFVVSIAMIISTQITCIGLSIHDITRNTYESRKCYQDFMWGLWRCVRSIDCLISSIALFLYFNFTKKYYYCLCNKCHTCIQNYCKNVTESRINAKQYSIL